MDIDHLSTYKADESGIIVNLGIRKLKMLMHAAIEIIKARTEGCNIGGQDINFIQVEHLSITEPGESNDMQALAFLKFGQINQL